MWGNICQRLINTGIKKRKVKFSMNSPCAIEIILIGNFNNWNSKKHPMHKNKNWIWIRSVMLAPKITNTNFWFDGQWKEDPNNNKTCLRCFGTLNSVLDLA